ARPTCSSGCRASSRSTAARRGGCRGGRARGRCSSGGGRGGPRPVGCRSPSTTAARCCSSSATTGGGSRASTTDPSARRQLLGGEGEPGQGGGDRVGVAVEGGAVDRVQAVARLVVAAVERLARGAAPALRLLGRLGLLAAGDQPAGGDAPLDERAVVGRSEERRVGKEGRWVRRMYV